MIIIILLIITIFTSYVLYIMGEEVVEDVPIESKIVDDRINPYIYQGLTVEILRMRNRRIIDKMLTFGTSWRNPPTFYYVVDVDGEVGDSSLVEAAGGVVGEGTFNEWDTMLKECRTNFKTEEGQKKSYVKITIMEIHKSGFRDSAAGIRPRV